MSSTAFSDAAGLTGATKDPSSRVPSSALVEGQGRGARAPSGAAHTPQATPADVTLDSALLAAHDEGDGWCLAQLYVRAGDLAEADGRVDATCFFLTQAYVFALEVDHPLAETLHARLFSYGRED